MFPGKCLWPEPWMRNTHQAWGECLLSLLLLSFGLRTPPETPFLLRFPHQGLQLAPLLGIRRPERNTWGSWVAPTKAVRIIHGERGHGHNPPALRRQTRPGDGKGCPPPTSLWEAHAVWASASCSATEARTPGATDVTVHSSPQWHAPERNTKPSWKWRGFRGQSLLRWHKFSNPSPLYQGHHLGS